MARTWTLGGTELPLPQGYTPTPVVNSAIHDTLRNRTVKQVRGRKTTHRLTLDALTQAEYAAIAAVVEQNISFDFVATDGDLVISTRKVHAEIIDRKHRYKGSEFRQDIILELKEVN